MTLAPDVHIIFCQSSHEKWSFIQFTHQEWKLVAGSVEVVRQDGTVDGEERFGSREAYRKGGEVTLK